MSTHAQAKFEVQSWDENTYDELDGDAKLTRASVGQAFTGDLEGEGSVEWLMCYREDKTAEFVGLQRFVGRLGARSGSFVMHDAGRLRRHRGQGQPRRGRRLGHRGAGRHHRHGRRSPRRWGPRPRSSSTTTSSSPMAALARDGNVLGALSLVVADQMSDAVAAAADQSLTAAAALSALEHFADGCSIDRLRRILGLTSSGTVRLVDRLVAAGEVRRARGPRRAHDERGPHRRGPPRRAPRDRRPRRRARGSAGRPLPRRAARPRAPRRARARRPRPPEARAREARVHALDLPAVRHATRAAAPRAAARRRNAAVCGAGLVRGRLRRFAAQTAHRGKGSRGRSRSLAASAARRFPGVRARFATRSSRRPGWRVRPRYWVTFARSRRRRDGVLRRASAGRRPAPPPHRLASMMLSRPAEPGPGSRPCAAHTRPGACAGRRCGRCRGAPRAATVLPPASRYMREAGISSGKPPPATRSTGRGAILGIIGIRDGDGFMPEMARTDCIVSQPIAPSSAPLGLALSPSTGRAAPSETTAASRRSCDGRVEQHLAAERDAEAGDPLRVHVGPPRRGSRGPAAIAGWALSPRPLECPVALAVARVVERQHAVAVAGEHPHVGGDAPAAAARAVAEQDGGAVARRDVPGGELAPVAHGDADLLVRDPDRRLVDGPARSVGGQVADRERHARRRRRRPRRRRPNRARGRRASRGPLRRGARRGAAVATMPGRDEQQPAHDVADAGDVAPVRARVDDVQAVGDDAEPDGQQPDDDARARAGWAASRAAGPAPTPAATARITATPSADVSGPESARSSRWAVTSASPASRSGRSARAIRSRQRRRRDGEVGAACGSVRTGSSVIGVMPPRSLDRAPERQRAAPWAGRRSTGV